MKLLLIICITFLGLLFLIPPLYGQSPTHLNYEGSSTIGNFMKDANSFYPDATFKIATETESTGGEVSILEGRCDIAGVARIPDASVLARGIVSTHIGWDAIAVIVHPSNPIKNLSIHQLREIYTGEITNWNQVGGPDLSIHTYAVGNGSATRKVFRSIVLGQEQYKISKVIKPDSQMIQTIIDDPAGIGQISFSFLQEEAGVKKLDIDGFSSDVNTPSYPIKRPLYLLWWPGRETVANFIQWTLSGTGQRILRNNFVGLSSSITQTQSSYGTLVVYTQTEAIEDGGMFYYPHLPYELYSNRHELLRSIPNRLNNTDESPTKLKLKPGSYIVKPTLIDGTTKEILITIEPGKLTSVDVEAYIGTPQAANKALPQKVEEPNKRLEFNGDFRFRGEVDFSSRNTDGSFRKNRPRLRYRIRLGTSYGINDWLLLGLRLRTGVPGNAQSPHLNFGYLGFVSVPFQLDQAYMRVRKGGFWAWMGKNTLPFWKQNELWWDDDVNPEGLAFGYKYKFKTTSLEPRAGLFITNHDHNGIIKNGLMLGGQLVGNTSVKKAQIDLASGYYHFHNLNNVPEADILYTDTRYKLTYRLWISSCRVRFTTRIPVAIGLDLMLNLADYSQDTVMPQVFKSQKTGAVASLLVGQQKSKGDWLVGYYFAYKQQNSVVAYFAEDDWVRWGNIYGNRNTNYLGHELRVAYNFGRSINAVLRGYFVQGLVTTNTHTETGARVRLDINMSF